MDELLGIACFLCVALPVIAVVGHGIWLLAAGVGRLLSGSTETPLSFFDRHRIEVEGFRQRLTRWRDKGLIDADQYESLAALLEAEERRLAAPPGSHATSAPAMRPVPLAEVGQASGNSTAPTMVVRPIPVDAPFVTGRQVPTPFTDEEIYVADVVDTPFPTGHQSQPVHALDRPDAAPPPKSLQPARTLADMLQAFMEAKNIRWVELISGVLIVVSAVGLVISLRATLKDKIPYFPALSFLLMTAAIHAAGIYSLRRWNLKATSRGVLIIGTLLVPLSVLASILLAGGDAEQSNPAIFAVAVVVGFASFATMNYYASRALVRHGWWRMMLAVMGTSLGQVVVHRWQPDVAPAIAAALVLALPVGAFLLATGALLRDASRHPHLERRRTQQLFLELGIFVFALVAPVSVYVSHGDRLSDSLGTASPILSLAAAAVLAAGLLAQRLITARNLSSYRTAATSLAILGGGLMLLLVAFAWPQLNLLIAVGLMNFALLTAFAVYGGLPLLHVAAVGCLGMAYLSGIHAWRDVGSEPGIALGRQVVQATFTGFSGLALTGFSIGVACVAGVLSRKKVHAREHGRHYMLAAAGLSALVIGVAAYAGYFRPPSTDRDLTTPIFLFYCSVLFVAAPLLARRKNFRIPIAGTVPGSAIAAMTSLGALLLLMALIHGLHLNTWLRAHLSALELLPPRPILFALISHSLGCAAIVFASAFVLKSRSRGLVRIGPGERRGRMVHQFVRPLAWASLATSIAASPSALAVLDLRFGTHAIYVALVSVAWLALALTSVSRIPIAIFQLLSTISLVYCTTHLYLRATGFTAALWAQTHIQIQFAVLAGWCGAWSVIRHLTGRYVGQLDLSSAERAGRPTPSWLTSHLENAPNDNTSNLRAKSRETYFDQVLLSVITIGLVVIAIVRCIPGIWLELGIDGSRSANLIASGPWHVTTAWVAVTAVVGALIVTMWERLSVTTLGWIVFATFAAPFFAAANFDSDVAVASSLRWLAAALVCAWAIPACFFSRRHSTPIRWHDIHSGLRDPSEAMRIVSLMCGVATVVLLTTLAMVSVSRGNPPGGPLVDSFFARMGTSVSYATPLSLLVAVLFVYGIRESNARYFLTSSVLFQFAICLGCLIPVLTAGRPLDETAMASLLQWNTIGLAAFSCAWALARRWERLTAGNHERTEERFDLFHVQIGLLLAAFVLIAVWISSNLILQPQHHQVVAAILGGWPTYLGYALAVAVAMTFAKRASQSEQLHAAALAGFIAIPLVAASVHAMDAGAAWWGFHLLTAGQVSLALIAAGYSLGISRRTPVIEGSNREVVSASGKQTPSHQQYTLMFWSVVCTSVALLASLRGAVADPLSPWWSPAITLAGMAASALTALSLRGQTFAYLSTAIAGLAAFLFWVGLPGGHAIRNEWGFVCFHVMAICLAAIGWVAIEVFYQRRGERGLNARSYTLAVHRFVGVGAIAVASAYLVLGATTVVVAPRPILLNDYQTASFIATIVLIAVLFAASMWDRKTTYAAFGIYVVGLAAIVFAVERFSIGRAPRTVMLITAVAAYAVVSCWAWSWGSRLAVIGHRLGIPDPVAGLRTTARWLPGMTMFLVVSLGAASFVIVQGSDVRQLRMTAALVPFMLAAATAGLAQQHRRDRMQFLSFLMVGVGCVFLGWADIEPGWSDRVFLLRATRMLMAFCALAFVYGVVAARVLSPQNGWRHAARRAAVAIAGAAIVSLLGVLLLEVVMFVPGEGAPMDGIQLAAVSVVLVGLVAAFLSLAMLPGRDPLQLSEHGRMAYVYAAQVVAGLLVAHIYLARPDLFGGVLQYYWPYIVVAIAFVGVGVSELFQRLGLRVLAEPFQRSGAFLALVPAIGMWMANSRSDYSIVLVVIGVLYMLLAFSQRSMVAGGIAAAAGNAALWSLLEGTEDLTFSRHPQFWLIPPALSVLLASQINRKRLTPAQLAAIRYVSIGVIYLSSFVEMLKIGIGQSLWPPVIMIVLALAGVVFGIAMQIRAYLYLGSIFILVAMISMVAHAAQSIQHVWPWWAFGIALGVSIMVLFGWFEGHRTQMTALVHRLRQWEK